VDSTGTCSTGSSILTLGGHAYRLCEPGEYRDVVFDTVSF
jgi:hypothetical protein